jgi:hypothetical protein
LTEKDHREFKSNLEIHTQQKELNFPEFQGTNENLALNFIDNNNKKLNDDSQLKVQTKLAGSKTTKFDFLLLDKDFFENDLCLCCISDKTKRKRGKILHDTADRKIIVFLDQIIKLMILIILILIFGMQHYHHFLHMQLIKNIHQEQLHILIINQQE